MNIIKSEQVIYFDVDDTLVMHGKIKKSHRAVAITCPYSGDQLVMRVHMGHVKILKDRFARGATNIVWSAAGWQWALAVVKALKLEAYVAQVQSKPRIFVDDKLASEILGERLYLDVNTEYGK